MTRTLAIETQLAQAGSRCDPRTGALSVPIYQTASFAHPALGQSTGFDYSRTSNPTRLALENALASAEGGCRGFAFASGLAAIDAVLRLFEPGSRVVVTEDVYGGTFRLFEKAARPFGIVPLYVDTSDTEAVRRALDDVPVRALFIESPTNPLLKVADLPALIALARGNGALVIVDNTFMSPYLQRPIECGFDIVVHSATKFLGGHSDLIAGVVVAREAAMARRLKAIQNSFGGILGPQDSWLTLRGIKTLGVRMEAQQTSAETIVRWLREQPAVRRVYLSYPATMSHAAMPREERQARGISDGLVRLSVGLEDAGDILADLSQALVGGSRVAPSHSGSAG